MEIKKYLKRKWAPALLFTLKEGNHTFNELMEKFSASPNTVSDRLKEGQEKGLISQTLGDENGRSKIKYRLEDCGVGLAEGLSPIEDRYWELRDEIKEIREKMKKNKEEIHELVDGLDLEDVEGASEDA